MTQAATALKPATLVPEARRMAFLPALFSPALMLIGERAVYQFMSWLAPDDYTGGLWHFHEREGQPLFMSPDADKRFRIFCETNGYMGEVSAEAAAQADGQFLTLWHPPAVSSGGVFICQA